MHAAGPQSYSVHWKKGECAGKPKTYTLGGMSGIRTHESLGLSVFETDALNLSAIIPYGGG